MNQLRCFVSIGLLAFLLLAGCNFDFPLTARPTRAIDARLIGNWTAQEPGEKRVEHLNIRQLDDHTYIAVYEGDLYRGFHSDVAGFSLLSVQDLNPAPGRYLYMQYRLLEDGTKLGLRSLDAEMVKTAAQDQKTTTEFIRLNTDNPKLFSAELIFLREPDRH